jgi:hypothetical protein
MDEETASALFDKLSLQQEAVSNHKELSEFVMALLAAYEDGYFEEQSIRDYLEGMAHLSNAMDSWARNVGYGPGAPEQPDWPWMARLLHAAFEHS